MDFSQADQLDPLKFNQILWKGLISNKPFKVKKQATVMLTLR
jgi:hypothetical protein